MENLDNIHIRLRALEPEDLEILYAWENDMNIWHLSNTLIPFSKSTLNNILKPPDWIFMKLNSYG